MSVFKRRTAPKVMGGRVLRKNRHKPTANYWNTRQKVPVIDKERCGHGYRHLLRKKDILEFIEIIPDWNELATGLDAVLLAAGETDCDGWYDGGVIGLCAWERDLWREAEADYYGEHKEIFARLGVPCEPRGKDFLCKFTKETARAYQLLHVFLHELGHHHDRMTTKSKDDCGRGEGYANDWALNYEPMVWDRYLRTFGLN